VLDDDRSIHNAWDERFLNALDVKIMHFYSIQELSMCKVDPRIPVLYLIDYELLPDSKNGLDVIEELKLNNEAILVTSCFEDITIRNRCKNIGVKIIPKPYVPYIKIIKKPNAEVADSIVFIDDDEMMRKTWIFAADDAGKKISTYPSFDDFTKEINIYDKNTVIYIDSDLGNNIRGELCAKYLFDKGFTEIHVATGYPKDRFNSMPWIKSIVGKEPPFPSNHEN
jgi:FixJ family two-component response regulator